MTDEILLCGWICREDVEGKEKCLTMLMGIKDLSDIDISYMFKEKIDGEVVGFRYVKGEGIEVTIRVTDPKYVKKLENARYGAYSVGEMRDVLRS